MNSASSGRNARESEASAPERKPSTRWITVWLSCIAFYYPALWLSNSVLWAMPSLVRIVLFAERLDHIQLNRFGAFASSIPRKVLSSLDATLQRPNPFSLGTLLPPVLVIVTLLLVVGRRSRLLSGLAVAMLGQLALPLWVLRPSSFQKQITVTAVLAFLFFFGVLSLGLRWMLPEWGPRGYRGRVGSPLAGFVLVWPALWLLRDLISRIPPSWWPLLPAAPGTAAALLVGLPRVRTRSNEPQWTGWKSVAWGAAISVLLTVGVRKGQAIMERARIAENRSAMAAYPKIPTEFPFPKLFFQSGVNFTAEGWGGYEAESARLMLERFPKYGINAVALVPYGFASGKPPHIHFPGSLETDEGLEIISRVAHARGIQLLLKPVIWDADNLEFSSAEGWAQWFSEYRRFLEHYVRLATQIHADVFCVGGEFVKLSQYDTEWRKLIARVREIYPGPLVYAANHGQEFESVTFWDAFDYIGLQEYYPLPDDLSTDSLVLKVEAVQRKFQRPVIFTEAGFSSLNGANREPWEGSRGRNLSPELQARCYEAILRAFYFKPWFQGVYWWKVGTNGYGGPKDDSHTPWGKPAMEVVARYYLRDRR